MSANGGYPPGYGGPLYPLPGGPGPPPPSAPPPTPPAIYPSLLTSTGGLYGTYGAMLTPYYNTVNKRSYVLIHDPTNFNCEENGEYDFRQEIPVVNGMAQEGRDVSCHLIILKYREIGVAIFNVNVTVYRKLTDDFATKSIPIAINNITSNRKSFPDRRIHTRRVGLSPVITGERPQVTLTYSANSGPWAVTSLTLCGDGDETPQF
jgi:hypothetical protein